MSKAAAYIRGFGKPTVSVLIKSFNHAGYVRQTIESVLDQGFDDFEIVVTDDASTDGTPDIIASFDDPRIRLHVFKKNQGISNAMNATIARARGRYLAILNSDDWALPNRLRDQVGILDAHPECSLSFSAPSLVDDDGIPFKSSAFREPLSFNDLSPASFLRHFFYTGNCLCAPTAMIRREAYESVGPYDPRLLNTQDYDMWIRMLLAGHRIHWSPTETTAYRIRRNFMNASEWGGRIDALIRVHFETAKVLERFADTDPRNFKDIFGDPWALCDNSPVPLRVAEVALRCDHPARKALALNLYFDHAKSPEEIQRFILLSGSIDLFGLAKPVTAPPELNSPLAIATHGQNFLKTSLAWFKSLLPGRKVDHNGAGQKRASV